MKFNNLIYIVFSVFITSCYNNRDDYGNIYGSVNGYAPIYMDSTTLKSQVKSNPPQPISTAGKIYLYKQFLFVNEPNLGIHVFDNSDSLSPMPLCFITVPNISDIVTKDDILYVQTYFGLLYFNIAALPAISDITLFTPPNFKYTFPPLPRAGQINTSIFRNNRTRTKVYFECIDPSKGTVIGWKETVLENPKCYQ